MLVKLRLNDGMMRLILVILLILTLTISEAGAVTSVTSKMVEANFSGPITLITITTDRLGILTYIENYYLIDDSGALKYDRGVKYYEKGITRNRFTLEISRPNSSSGRPYPAILATVLIDNQTVFQGWFKQYKQQKYQNVQNPQESPSIQTSIQNTQNAQIQGDQSRKLPGFEIIAAIFVVSAIYWFRRQKK